MKYSSYKIVDPFLVSTCVFEREGYYNIPSGFPDNCISHSCYPNMAINSKNQLKSLRDVRKGELLTIDFSTFFIGNKAIKYCNCGFNGCRQRILGFDFLPDYFQHIYLEQDAVPQFIRDLFLH